MGLGGLDGWVDGRRELACCIPAGHPSFIYLLLLLWQVATFLEANGRGYWDAQPEQLERLRQMYM